MANVRIKDLTTTAATTASDDFFGVDGATNGTRKLNAYSPTFGGNLTVNGATISQTVANPSFTMTDVGGAGSATISLIRGSASAVIRNDSNLTFNLSGGGIVSFGPVTVADNTADSTSADSGALQSRGGLGIAKKLFVGGNLTVSGTGTSTFSGNTLFNPSTAGNNYTLWKSGSVFVGGMGDGSAFGTTANDFVVHGYTGSTKIYSNSALAATFTSTGNLLIGTTVDSANGKLQLATHTTSAGGIGFGTDTSLYREAAGTLSINHSGGDSRLYFYNAGTAQGRVESASSNFFVTAMAGSLILRSGGATTALTLDSSQRTILSGALRLANSYVATPQVSTGYVTIQDSTGTTYKVLVAP